MFHSIIKLYKEAYGGLSRNIWLLSLVMFINRSGTMVLAFLTLYNKELGYTVQQGGWMVAIYGIGAFIGAYLGGKLSDSFGFYYVQFGALFFGGWLFILLGQMNGYLYICSCIFILSIVNESFRPANASAIFRYSNSKNRTQSYSLVRLAINLGWGIGVVLGGFLASVNYHLLFWVDGTTNIFAAIVLLVVLPKKLAKPELELLKELNPEKNSSISPFRDLSFLFFLLFVIFFATCFFQLFTTVPIYFKDQLHLNEFWIGLVMSVNGLSIALFEMIVVYKLEGHRPYLFYITAGCLLMGVAFLMLNLPVSMGFLVAIIAVLLLTLAEMISMPFMNSYYIGKSNENNRGQLAGMYTMALSIAQVIGSSAGALLLDQIGFFHFWFVVSFICVLASGGFLLILKKNK